MSKEKGLQNTAVKAGNDIDEQESIIDENDINFDVAEEQETSKANAVSDSLTKKIKVMFTAAQQHQAQEGTDQKEGGEPEGS